MTSKIRQAILNNRGGLAAASDAELMEIWNRLDKETKDKYLASVKTKQEAKDADSDQSK